MPIFSSIGKAEAIGPGLFWRYAIEVDMSYDLYFFREGEKISKDARSITAQLDELSRTDQAPEPISTADEARLSLFADRVSALDTHTTLHHNRV